MQLHLTGNVFLFCMILKNIYCIFLKKKKEDSSALKSRKPHRNTVVQVTLKVWLLVGFKIIMNNISVTLQVKTNYMIGAFWRWTFRSSSFLVWFWQMFAGWLFIVKQFCLVSKAPFQKLALRVTTCIEVTSESQQDLLWSPDERRHSYASSIRELWP